jgi:HPr kinase/phosphorylase
MDIPVHRLILEKGKEFDLELIAGEKGLENKIRHPELHRPGLAFAGFLDVFTWDRIQVLGNTEIGYLNNLPPEERRLRLESIFRYAIPCFVITSSNQASEELIELCNLNRIPLLITSHESTRFNTMMNFWLEREFAPMETIHGVFMDVYGEGVLITGDSGVGKSECAIELVERGHRLVADDVVIIKRIGRNILLGSSPASIQHHMEVRGLGIIDVELLFGMGSVREEKRVSVNVDLQRWTDDIEIDRLGLDTNYGYFLDVAVRKFMIPVDSGRNISLLIEVAALHHRMLEHGINPAEELNKRLIQGMKSK